MSQENIECIRKCLQEGYDQGPGLGWDEPEADGGEGYERVHGDVVAPLKSDESMSVLDLMMWRAGRKHSAAQKMIKAVKKKLAVKISVEEELVKKAIEEE